MSVNRWQPTIDEGTADMAEHPQGDYVEYTEYTNLMARLALAEKLLDLAPEALKMRIDENATEPGDPRLKPENAMDRSMWELDVKRFKIMLEQKR